MLTIKKILVPTDLSDNASTAYHSAQQLAEKYGATVDFIHIIPENNYFSESMADLDISFNTAEDLYSKVKRDTSAQLQELMDNYIKQENRGTCLIKVAAKPSKAISEKAMNSEYDLIVMAAKGKHVTGFWFHMDEEKQTLTHSMFTSLFPNWTGQTQPRIVS